ncbi:hypothetical protein ACFZA9_11665 [Streptomyces olivaceus]|uniref:hypothetical protein n=1 Tax=Streptomyces olivaceus TaxID=47716 RepID=UPI0036E19E75
MSGVRPGPAASRGGTGSRSATTPRGGTGSRAGTGSRPGGARGTSRTSGDERALTSVAAGDRFRGEEPDHTPRLWHVTLSVSGARAPLTEVRRALEQLAHDHPFLLTSRYADDHAEIRYWEEARDLHDAAAVALRLWGEHRQTAGLPPWEIVGLEVIDRATYHQRIAAGYGPAPATPVGVHPF